MSKRTIVRSQWYYNEQFPNLIAINHEDMELNPCKQVKITNKHGSYLFDCSTAHFVPRGAIALTYYQRKKYRLKTYHSYYVEIQRSVNHHSMSSLFNDKFSFRARVGGADDVFEKLSCLLLLHLYPRNFHAQAGMHKPRVILFGPPGTGKTLIARTICDIFNVQPQFVRGPEIFSRFLGDSEKKIAIYLLMHDVINKCLMIEVMFTLLFLMNWILFLNVEHTAINPHSIVCKKTLLRNFLLR